MLVLFVTEFSATQEKQGEKNIVDIVIPFHKWATEIKH